MIFTSFVLLALTLLVAWDSAADSERASLSGAPEQSDRRKLDSARRPWSLALPTVSSTVGAISAEYLPMPASILNTVGRLSLQPTLRILRTPTFGGRRIWNLSASGVPPNERSKA